ncbi:ATP-binding protein [Azospirillum sp.]|uniref:ATP-binding protein n=1 Tax=Azospirillum sp. TaxID=34012 RepID=UPI003D73616C
MSIARTDSQTDAPSRRPIGVRVLWAVALAATVALASWQTHRWVEASGLAELRRVGEQRLGLYASGIRTAIGRYDYLPFLLARDKDVLALLAAPSPERQAIANHLLETANEAAGSAALFVTDRTGMTLAASNWNDPAQSFVGNSYDFRPYFRQAARGGSGRYYGVGATTGVPGYFLSRAATGPEGLAGVAIVKVDLEPLQRDWQAAGERVLVTDENGVVFLASHAEWKYRPLRALAEPVRAQLAATRQYAGADLRPLGLTSRPDGTVTLPGSGALLMQELALPDLGATVRLLSDVEPVLAQARGGAVLTAALVLLLAAGLLLARQRAETLRLQREANETLERRVDERTRELAAANQVLRDAQEELVQAGKLAALGQMSAALAHEFNQPLAAIRTFVASTRLLAERGDTPSVLGNLGMIADMAERMAVISGHLKTFARKGPARVEAVPVGQALDRALLLLGQRLRHDGIDLTRAVPDNAVVRGDAVRLEQVLVNLIRNAADALSGVEDRRIAVSAVHGAGVWEVRISDTGTGIAPEHQARLFDPFFTTKEVGEGLGLGLSLSYGIVRDFGGSLRAENNAQGGATFVMILPEAAHG